MLKYKGISPILFSRDEAEFNVHCIVSVLALDDELAAFAWHVIDPGGATGVLLGHNRQSLILILPELGLKVLAGHNKQD